MSDRLCARLCAAGDYVRRGAVLADVGTDHAYLPISLAEKGAIARAVATDVNRGPLERAERNIKAAGLSDKISTRLTDGLDGLADTGITDIAICGMGGELIARIVDAAAWVKDSAIRLVLQPMTKAETLREYLAANGFEIFDETLVREDRIYQVICAGYTGKITHPSPAGLLLGEKNIEKRTAEFFEFSAHKLAEVEKRRDGLAFAGRPHEDEDELIREIKHLSGTSAHQQLTPDI